MADGCNLYLTEKDLNDVESSIDKGKVIDESKFAANALDCLTEKYPESLIKVLDNKLDPRHDSLTKLTIESFGKGKLGIIEESKLPSAVKEILKFTLDTTGLFKHPPKEHGPGASRVRHPYEVIAAAAIVQNRTIYSKSGVPLKLYNTDRIDFGHKHATNHFMKSKGGTHESDIYISRKPGEAPVGVDAKYSSSGIYKSFLVSDRQLSGIRKSIGDGQLEEFFFVTNGQFDGKLLERISQFNRLITKDWIEYNKEFYGFKDISQNYVDNNYNELIKEYNIPRIQVCEHVSFKI